MAEKLVPPAWRDDGGYAIDFAVGQDFGETGGWYIISWALLDILFPIKVWPYLPENYLASNKGPITFFDSLGCRADVDMGPPS